MIPPFHFCLMRAFGYANPKKRAGIQLRLTAKLGTPKVCHPHPALRATFPWGKVLFPPYLVPFLHKIIPHLVFRLHSMGEFGILGPG